jgi:hypothetical protein
MCDFSNSHHHLNCFAIVYLSQNHYLYLEIHKNLVVRYLDFWQTLIDINGDGLPDRVFDHNPEADDQPGFFVYLNTGDGFDSGKQWQSNLGGEAVTIDVNQHRAFAVFVRWAIFPIVRTT